MPPRPRWMADSEAAALADEGACDRGRSHSRHPRADRRGDRSGGQLRTYDLRSPIRRLSHLHGWRRSSPPTPQQPSRKLCIPTARNTPRAPVRRAEGDGRPGRPPPRRGVVLQRPPTPRPCDRHRLRRRTATLRRLLPDVWGPKDRISLGRNPPWDTRVVALVVPEHATTEPPSRCASNADDSPARRPGGCGRGSSRTAQRSGSTTRRGPIPPRGSHHGRRVRR
jgi:hypothetical protein